jgi:diaminohydroxyphosphoribosylaminopyrimidine deaminase/5-amino-6-(5-phosphoribosylamino)uracil reductase
MKHEMYMYRAIELSELGLGRTFPNPIVGAVIVNDSGEIIGEGFHAGKDHAEIIALSDCLKRGEDPRGSTIYVSLEPCNHFGKTPPCTRALIAAGILRVIYAVNDPNSLAQGGGEYLQSEGVQVVNAVLEEEAAEANRAWLHKISKGRPYIIWKIATTMDGYSAALDGTSKWITCAESRADVQRLRSESDAIVVGTGTVLNDNPSLVPRGDVRRPLRIVVGTRTIPSNFNVYNDEAETVFLPSHQSAVLLDLLREREINQVLLEAGSTLGSSLLREGMVDEFRWYQAPTILGSGIKAVGDLHVATLENRIDYRITDVARVGRDIRTVFRPISQKNVVQSTCSLV